MATGMSKMSNAASEAIIYGGANISEMCALFKMDSRTLKQRMYGIKPCGDRAGHPIYPVHEVVKRLYTPSAKQFEEMIGRLRHQDLPAELTKEYWAGLRSKQNYQRDAGELWSTEEVVGALGEVLKLVKMNTQLCQDTVERTTELSDRQRGIIAEQMRSMLEGTRKSVLDHCKGKCLLGKRPVTQDHIDNGVPQIGIEDDDPL